MTVHTPTQRLDPSGVASLPVQAPLAQFGFVWFVPVMGWCGLAQAWLRVTDASEGVASFVAAFAGTVASLIFLLVGGLSLLRENRDESRSMVHKLLQQRHYEHRLI